MGNYRKILGKSCCLLLTVGILIGSGCAGPRSSKKDAAQKSQNGDLQEVEEMLGVHSGEPEVISSQEVKDEDLLELLRMNESSEANRLPEDNKVTENIQISENTTTAPAISGKMEQGRQLKKKVAELNAAVRERDQTIAELKARIMTMEEEVLERNLVPGRQKRTVTKTARSTRSADYSSGSGHDDYSREYYRGYQLLKERHYRDAIQVFERLLSRDSEHDLADNAQYWIGECRYFLRDYKAAIMAFEKVFAFRNSNKNDYAQYKLGLCYYKLNNLGKARQEFQTFIDNYKDSPLVEKAEEYILRL